MERLVELWIWLDVVIWLQTLPNLALLDQHGEDLFLSLEIALKLLDALGQDEMEARWRCRRTVE